MREKTNPQPFCSVSGCVNRATKWDGGIDSYHHARNEHGQLQMYKNPPQFRCDEHDPYNKWFDIHPGDDLSKREEYP